MWPKVVVRVSAVATLAATPVALFCIWMNAVWNVRPTAGMTAVAVRTRVVEAAPGTEVPRDVVLDVYDDEVDLLYYLWADLLHLFAVLVVLLLAATAVGAFWRRGGRVLASVVLASVLAVALTSAFAAPLALDRAVARAIVIEGLPATEPAGRDSGINYWVEGPMTDLGWWTPTMLGLAALSATLLLWSCGVIRGRRIPVASLGEVSERTGRR